MKKIGSFHSVTSIFFWCLALFPAVSSAQENATGMKNETGWTVAVSAPVARLEFSASQSTRLQPSFLPGLGGGYVWRHGNLGVFGFPTLAALSKDSVIIAPHVAAHLFFFDVGVGYQWTFRRNIAGDLAAYSNAFILTFGVGTNLNYMRSR